MVLPGSDMEICYAYETIANVQATFKDIRNNSDKSFMIFTQRQINSIAERVDKAPLIKPCTVSQ